MKAAGLLLFKPNHLNPQKKNSFPKTDKHTESIWVELQYNTTHGLQKLLINLSYNPNKNHNKFLDSLALQNDVAVSKKKEWSRWVIII